MADPVTAHAATAHPFDPDAYDPQAVEAKWRGRWAERGTNRPDLANAARPYYQLMMFPYPSAEGLHVGNLYAFTGTDIHGRFQRLQGHTVFEPIGFDAFGIHSENYALKVGVHPTELIPRNVANFTRQLDRTGLMVDWGRTVDTTTPEYYKWTQWVFLQLLERGLAYKKQAAVNWCPFDKTVLANEQVVGGRCERCDTPVEQRLLEQWFFRISEYAPRLLANLDALDWSETTKTAQRNWIGKSEGAEIHFSVQGAGGSAAEAGTPLHAARSPLAISVFTTRPDTLHGATYLVLAPEHPLVDAVVAAGERAGVDAYRAQTARQDVVARKVDKEKTGAFTGAFAVNPATGAPIPIWIADYVLMEYGTGAIMAVPGHDERDFEFATKFALPIVRVVAGDGDDAGTPLAAAHTAHEGGRVVNSGALDGMTPHEARRAVVAMLEARGAGKAVVNYRLHDWCISRQRYWGPPIPIVYCDACGMQQVPVEQLPVVLPNVADFKPDDSGVSPLARHAEWYHVPCPECGRPARRETDVSDTFLDSAWYFLRYPSAGRADVPFDRALTKKWLPVDSYIGGNEHAVLHLLYSRFITMVLHDMGHLDFEEPFTRFRAHGLIIKDGAKMSKSKGNIINPDEYIERWGADAFRTYLMFLGPFEQGGDFRASGISGVRRFLERLWGSVVASGERAADGVQGGGVRPARDERSPLHAARSAPDPAVLRKLHQTIKKVTEDIPRLSYNTAIAAMMEYMNVLRAGERAVHADEVRPLVQLVAPFAPHVAEELWERLGGREASVFDAGWPGYDPALTVQDVVTLAVQVGGKLRGTVALAPDATEADAVAAALAVPEIAKWVTGTPRKTIFVRGRLLNLVV